MKRLIEMAVEGFRCTCFCYGQTGSGKTHTLTGPPGLVSIFLFNGFQIFVNQTAVYQPLLATGRFGNSKLYLEISTSHRQSCFWHIFKKRIISLAFHLIPVILIMTLLALIDFNLHVQTTDKKQNYQPLVALHAGRHWVGKAPIVARRKPRDR